MAQAPIAPKSGDPIGAYVTHKGTDKGEDVTGFAAYDASGRAWPVDAAKAEALGIRRAKA